MFASRREPRRDSRTGFIGGVTGLTSGSPGACSGNTALTKVPLPVRVCK
ncbi:chaplin family protein [Pantoea allii]